MYQAMLPSNTMVQIMNNPRVSGPVPQSQNHTVYVNGVHIPYQSEFALYNPDVSNYSRPRIVQAGSYPLEMLQLMGVEVPPLRRMSYNLQCSGSPNNNWQRRSNSTGSALPMPPPHLNFIKQNGTGSVKKSNWCNKSGRRSSYRGGENVTQKETYRCDRGFNSRSPTPNKYLTDGSQTESSDDRDSVTSQAEQGNKRLQEVHHSLNFAIHDCPSMVHSGFIPNASAHQFYQNQRPVNYHSALSAPRLQVQNYQNKRRYSSERNSPPPQRNQRSKKYTGAVLPTYNMCSRYLIAPDRFLARAHLIEVTERPEYLLNGSVWDSLSESIWEKFRANQQTEVTFRNKMMLWKYLYIYIKSTFPRYGLFLVGSTMNGFGSNNSDVDMCLIIRHSELSHRTEAISHLAHIMKCLKRCEFIDQIELIQAKVPILKFHDSMQNLEVDLNCNNAVGIRNTHLLYCYSRIDWRVRPLVLIVKLWAQIQNINDAKNMTISSYSLVLMVIHFLQCGANPSILPCLHMLYKGKFEPTSDIHTIDIQEDLDISNSQLPPLNRQSLGELFVNFFKYYINFDFKQYAISVRLAKKIPIEECRMVRSFKNDPHQWKYLCIEEPFDQTNTARSVYDPEVFERIKKVFKLSYEKLSSTRDLSSIFVKLISDT